MKYTLPIRTVNRNNARLHWAALHRATRDERRAACLLTRSVLDIAATARIERLGAVITLTRIGKRKMDSDNLAGCLKGIRDGIAEAIGVDDGDDRLRWVYEQRTEWRYAVEVEVLTNEP